MYGKIDEIASIIPLNCHSLKELRVCEGIYWSGAFFQHYVVQRCLISSLLSMRTVGLGRQAPDEYRTLIFSWSQCVAAIVCLQMTFRSLACRGGPPKDFWVTVTVQSFYGDQYAGMPLMPAMRRCRALELTVSSHVMSPSLTSRGSSPFVILYSNVPWTSTRTIWLLSSNVVSP